VGSGEHCDLLVLGAALSSLYAGLITGRLRREFQHPTLGDEKMERMENRIGVLRDSAAADPMLDDERRALKAPLLSCV